MADVTITDLPNASTPLSGSERIPMDQAGVTVDAPASAVAALALSRANHTGSQVAGTISDFATATRLQIQGGLTAGSNITIASTGSGDSLQQVISAPALSTAVRSLTAGITGASAVTNLVSISQEDYDDLPSYDPATLYYIPGAGDGGGTVSSVALTAPTGFSVSGSPVTTTGTLALTFAAGYALPTTAKQTEWDTAFSQTRQWNGSATGLVAATGRTSLELGDSATRSVGTGSGTVAAGNDSRFHDSVTLGAALTPIFTLTGQALGAVDHGADRLLFWDDSAGTLAPLTLGTNLSITGTTINASGGSGGGDVSLSGTPVAGQAAEWTNGTTIQGVAVTGTGSYAKGTGPLLTLARFSTEATITAGTNAQGQSPLTADINIVTTAANNPSAVTLPEAIPGRIVTIANRGANNVNVYPESGVSIDSRAVNTADLIRVNFSRTYFCASTTQWISSAEQTALNTIAGFGTGVGAALAIAVGSAGGPVVFNGAGGTPSSLTLTNATGLPVTGITASTSAALGVGTIELGAASDTTISRASAGVVAVEGVALARVIGSGTAAMGTTAIASGASATLVTVAATGVATTDVIDWGFNGNPNSVTGYSAASTTGCLVITAYPTAGNVNFLVSNPTAGSITPGALTLNWKVTR